MAERSEYFIPCPCGETVRSHERVALCKCGRTLDVTAWGEKATEVRD